jgi:phage terminase small subunit
MSAAAVAQWDAIGAWLVGWGVMLDRYEPSLAELCDAYASFVSISRAAEGQPYWIDTERGGLKVHPIWALKDQAAKRLKDSLSRHGLAPSAAPSIKTEQAPKASGLGALKLNRGNLPKLA